MEHEAGVEPACFGVKTQRGYRQPTARVRLIWIRRQESNLRGLRSERSWDTDNPRLSNLAGRHGLEPCKAGFGDQPPPCGRPRVGGAHCCRHRYPCGHDAVSGRSRVLLGLRSREWRKAEGTIPTPVRVPLVFEAETSPCSFHLPKWRMAVGLDPHTVAGTSRVQAGGAPRALHHPELAESSELESHAIAGARRLANECEPRSLYSPKW